MKDEINNNKKAVKTWKVKKIRSRNTETKLGNKRKERREAEERSAVIEL